MKKRTIPESFFIILISQLAVLSAFAVKAYPFPVQVNQPDGTTITILLHGNEFHHFKTTEDGYLLKENGKGILTYATISSTGEVVESEYTAHDAPNRSLKESQFLKTVNPIEMIRRIQTAPLKSKAFNAPAFPQKVFPASGSPKSIVILVNFSDTLFVTPRPQTAFTNLLNQDSYSTNGGTGSARDYFMASTYGKFSPEFDVYGPYTLPQPFDYYGKNDSNGNDTNAIQMIVDACTAAYNNGVDFSKYDTDNNGVIDNVFVYYAGHNEAEHGPLNSIWPHRWAIYPQSLFPSGYNYSGDLTSITFNGKRVMDYACTSELRGSTSTNMCGVGTFCHEFGHVLGLPDYYDTSGSRLPTLNSWDIMDSGNYNNLGRTPPAYSAYDRFFLGFLIPEPKTSTANLSLDPLYQGKIPPAAITNQAFLLSETTHNLNGANPNPNEFFMLEYRQKTGWDTYLPGEGMCIWHIDFNQTAWNNNSPNVYTGTTQTLASHMRVYLIPPTGVGTTPPTYAFTNGSFIPTLWDGTDINREITNIVKTTATIKFSLMSPILNTLGEFSEFNTTLGTPSAIQSITITALNLTGNLNLNLQSNSVFEMKLSTEVTWSKSLNIVPVSGKVNVIIQMRYNPLLTGIQTDQLGISNTDVTTRDFSLIGKAVTGPNSPVIYVGKIDNILSFQATRLNFSTVKTINIQTNDLSGDINVDVTGNDAAMFLPSATSIAMNAANGPGGTSITITYSPKTSGVHTAELILSGGGLKPVKVISLTGTGL